MTLILAEQHRGITRDITIQDGAGDTITPGMHDLVRVIIGRDSEIVAEGDVVTGAKLVVVSGSPTANGSTITTGASNRMRLDGSDLDFDAGTYSLWVEMKDNADAAEWKTIDRQVFQLEHT